MKSTKVNFTIPEDVAQKLRDTISERKRSDFVAEAVREKLEEMEEERFKKKLIEGYIERRQEDMELNAEWEPITLESWLPLGR